MYLQISAHVINAIIDHAVYDYVLKVTHLQVYKLRNIFIVLQNHDSRCVADKYLQNTKPRGRKGECTS